MLKNVKSSYFIRIMFSFMDEKQKFTKNNEGGWGLGVGDWGLGVGPNPPLPNPQSPIPNPQSPFNALIFLKYISC